MQENLTLLEKVVPTHMTMVRGEITNSLECILPTEQKDGKFDLQCGSRYLEILKESILSLKGTCYTPPKLPVTLDDDKNLPRISYFCKQCNDCFQFRSSFDDHMHRKSWILGYLCRICLPTRCTHVENDTSICWVCNNNMINERPSAQQKIEKTKNMKAMGIVKLFHNQCQFFQHLGAHNSTSIDLRSIMLMPTPIGLKLDEYHQLDRICSILMAYLFPRNIHIMDWLKIHKIDFEWWRANEFDENPVGALLKKYKEICSSQGNIKYDDIPFVDCGHSAKTSIPCHKKAKYSTMLAQIAPKLSKNNNISSSNNLAKSVSDQDHYILSKIMKTCSVQNKNEINEISGLASSAKSINIRKIMNEANNKYFDTMDSNILPTLSRLLKKRRKIKRLKKPCRIAFNGPDDLILDFNCHLCGERINTNWITIKLHFDKKHTDDYKLSIVRLTLTDNVKNIMSMDDIESRNLSNEKKQKSIIGECFSPKRKRHSHNKKVLESSFPSSLGIYIYQDPLEKIEGSFKCKKCDSLFKSINLLRNHVANTHRLKRHYFICLECGENFVVAPSLKMHLKAFHGIQDPSAYICKNVLCASNIDPVAMAKNVEANHCYVCMAVFEDKAAVDKHLRVHGMAFLNHKKIQAKQALEVPLKSE